MNKIKGRIKTGRLIILVTFLLHSNIVFSQFYADDVFESKCALCHTIGEGDLKGPDLLGVNERRPKEWLIKFIQSSNTVIESGDAIAVELFNKYNKTEMQDWNYSESEISEILEYISGFGGAAEGISEGITVGESKDTVAVLMDKLDELLKYYEDKKSANISDEDILKGKALFNGDLAFKNGAEACINCHNTIETDTLNGHPSAYDITQNTSYDLKTVLAKPASIKMREAFREHQLTNLEIEYVKYYLDNVSETGLIILKKINYRKYIFFGVMFLILIFLIDIRINKIFKNRRIHYLIILLSVFYLIREIHTEASRLSLSTGYEPEQPIKFSHKTHAGDNKINCLYCHSSAEHSKVAGIPSANLCLNCHKAIKSSSEYGKYEINKIEAAIKSAKPIEWIQVHNLPDHVFFSHAQHVTAGKRECQECHGKVEEMDRIRQVEDLSMGWCLDCHKDTEVQWGNNEYYKTMVNRHSTKEGVDSEKKYVVDFGGNDCQRCHY